MSNQKILLMSSSRVGSGAYLDEAVKQIAKTFNGSIKNAVFIPYASVTLSFDEYEKKIRQALGQVCQSIDSIHHCASPYQAIEQADAIVVGGGNTFALLSRILNAKLVEIIREKVKSGTAYIGWSAGSNVAGKTIRTTNDMPIVELPTFGGIGLVPFQLNPHFISGVMVGHNGESREERLAEFICMNPSEHVLALPEGSALFLDGVSGTVLGENGALHFSKNERIVKIEENERFEISRFASC